VSCSLYAPRSAALLAERDENTCRLDMMPSELVALGRALEELEQPKAASRQARPGQQRTSVSPDTNVLACTNQVVGQAIGMSSATYARAQHVVQTAQPCTLFPTHPQRRRSNG
jgi:hypothetical protein